MQNPAPLIPPSPCIKQCALSDDGSHCTGCRRTLDEIRRWSGMTPADKQQIWQRLLALPPRAQRKACAQCGQSFECGSASGACWCSELPPVAISAAHDCLCPACLTKRVAP